MKRSVIAGIAAAAVVVGAGVTVAKQASPSLPDVQVPAIELSNAEGVDATVAWLDLFTQTTGSGTDSFGNLQVPGEGSMVVIGPQDSPADFYKILDDVAGNAGSQLNAVTSPGNGPDAVTYLIQNNGS